MIKVFFSYAHEDEKLRDELAKHLKLLERQMVISAWHDREITAGTEWKDQIDENLETAQIILLLISSDFLASDYCYDVELARAMELHKAKEARVIPIILREVDWQGATFDKLQALPKNAKAVTNWTNHDQAFADIARAIRKVVEELKPKKNLVDDSNKFDDSVIRPCNVFQVPPLPSHFVERPEVSKSFIYAAMVIFYAD